MNPTPNETIAGIVRILRDTVSPSVADAHAQAQLTQAIAVLRALDAEDPIDAMRAHAAELDRLLDEATTWAAADGQRAPLLATLRQRPAGATGAQGFADVNARHKAVRRTLTAFIDTLAAWRLEHGTADNEALLRSIGSALAAPATPRQTQP